MPELPEVMNAISELYKTKNLNHRGHRGTQRKAFLVLNLAAPCLIRHCEERSNPAFSDICGLPRFARNDRVNNGFTSVSSVVQNMAILLEMPGTKKPYPDLRWL